MGVLDGSPWPAFGVQHDVAVAVRASPIGALAAPAPGGTMHATSRQKERAHASRQRIIVSSFTRAPPRPTSGDDRARAALRSEGPS